MYCLLFRGPRHSADVICNLPPKMKDKSDPAVKMLHKLGFGDGDEEPSEVA